MIYFTADTHSFHNNILRVAGVRRFDVGVDANGMSPVSLEDILAFWGGGIIEEARWSKSVRLLAFCSSGLFIATAQLGFFLRNASMVRSAGTMFSCSLSWPMSFANFCGASCAKGGQHESV